MDQAVELLAQWGNKLAELAVQVGPDVYALAAAAITVSSIATLVGGLGAILVSAVTAYISYRLVKEGVRQNKLPETRYRDPSVETKDEGVQCLSWIIGIAAGAFSFILLLVGIGEITDVWAWAGIYDPQLIIAKRVLGL